MLCISDCWNHLPSFDTTFSSKPSVLDEGSSFSWLFSSTARTLVSVAYGLDILPENDPQIELMERAMKMVFEASVPGRFLVVR